MALTKRRILERVYGAYRAAHPGPLPGEQGGPSGELPHGAEAGPWWAAVDAVATILEEQRTEGGEGQP